MLSPLLADAKRRFARPEDNFPTHDSDLNMLGSTRSGIAQADPVLESFPSNAPVVAADWWDTQGANAEFDFEAFLASLGIPSESRGGIS